jgi:hypothetical protein
MNKRRLVFFTNWLVTLFFLILPYTANAGVPPVKVTDSSRLKKEELLCRQIQDKAQKKQEIRKIVKTGIQMGYDACGVIKCSIKASGDLQQVIEGAVEAGTTKDVVSRCALDACPCAEAKDIVISGANSAKAKELPGCGQIQDKMKQYKEIRKTVKTSLQTSHDACGVLRCAVKGGGEASQVIAGAMDAGFTKNFASRCIFEACARDVSGILTGQLKQCNIEESGLGYSLPEEPDIIIPRTPVPKEGFLSPSGF